MSKPVYKPTFGLRVANLALSVIIALEGIAWDVIGALRDAREWVAVTAHKRYAKEIKERQNSHFRHDTTEIIES
jgi:hypothetical protein